MKTNINFIAIIYFLAPDFCFAHNPSGTQAAINLLLYIPIISLLIPILFIITNSIDKKCRAKNLISFFLKIWGMGIIFACLSIAYFISNSQINYEAYHYYNYAFIILIFIGNLIAIFNINHQILDKDRVLLPQANLSINVIRGCPKLLYILLLFIGVLNIIDISIDLLTKFYRQYQNIFIPILISVIQYGLGILCIVAGFIFWFQNKNAIHKTKALLIVYFLLSVFNALLRVFFDTYISSDIYFRFQYQIWSKTPMVVFVTVALIYLAKSNKIRELYHAEKSQ